MNDVPPTQEPPDEIDVAYRRASALDPSRPSPWVGRAVLAHAARVAAEQAAIDEGTNQAGRIQRTAADHRWWRPALFGTLAAAAVVGLLVAPQVFRSRTTPDADAPRQTVAEPVMPSPATPMPQAKSLPAPGATPESTAQSAQAATPAAAPAPPVSYVSPAQRSADDAAREKLNASVLARAPNAKARSVTKPNNSASSAAAQNTRPGETEITVTASRNQSHNYNSAPISASALARDSTALEEAQQSELPLGSPAELRRAAATGDIARLQLSLNEQLDVNSRDEAGRTALMLATLHVRTEAVKELLAHGADPNIADNMRITPLQVARSRGDTEIIDALKNAGAR